MGRVKLIPDWHTVRLSILERDGWRCTKCGRAGSLEVHHVTPLENGGHPTDPANLVTLCRDHHQLEHRGRGMTEGRLELLDLARDLR